MQQLLFHNAFLASHSILLVLFFATVLAAAAYDAKTFTIPHAFTYSVIVLFVIAAFLLPLSVVGLGWHLLSAFIAFLLGLGLFIAGLMGGGDVKLFAAIGLWVFPTGLLGLILCVTLSGLLVSLLWLLVKMVALKPSDPANITISDRYRSVKGTRIAYGPAIAAGTIIYYILSTQWP